jgi:hypothetical protein
MTVEVRVGHVLDLLRAMPDRLGRNGIGLELNPEYAEMATRRLAQDAPLFNGVPVEARTPLADKQGASGLRTYAGFNARWDAQEREREGVA